VAGLSEANSEANKVGLNTFEDAFGSAAGNLLGWESPARVADSSVWRLIGRLARRRHTSLLDQVGRVVSVSLLASRTLDGQ
jgi:hypothetical protein